MKYAAFTILLAFFLALAGLAFDNPKGTPPWVAKTMLSNVSTISETVTRSGRKTYATGVWVDPHTIVTNCHVSDAHVKLTWLDDGTKETTYKPTFATSYDETKVFQMTTVYCNRKTDIAILKSWWPNHDINEVKLDWRTPRFGEALYSAGYGANMPLAPKYGYAGAVLYGPHGREQRVTMPIMKGDSGSPVFDKWGRIRGSVNRAFMIPAGWNSIPAGDRAIMIPALPIMLALEKTEHYDPAVTLIRHDEPSVKIDKEE